MERLSKRGRRARWIDRVPRVGAALCLALAGCDEGATGDTAEITTVRVAPQVYANPALGASLRDRLGLETEQDRRAASEPAAPRFTYDLPAGWKALPPAEFRNPNLQHIEVESTQLSVAMFPNRSTERAILDFWREQVGQPPISDDELAALESRTVLGAPARIVEMRGNYTGMSAGSALEDAQVYGAIGRAGDMSLFVKMVVPADMAEEARGTFDFFLDSLRVAEPEAEMPAGHPPTGGAPSAAAGAGRTSDLTWTAPTGWTEVPPANQFREITFVSGDVEMYVSMARGDLAMNVNRWAGQLGAGPLDAAALAALPRVPSLGSEAVVYEGAGTLSAMRSPARPGQRMVAAYVALPDGSGDVVTVKMTGPDADVASARPVFMELLGTLGLRR